MKVDGAVILLRGRFFRLVDGNCTCCALNKHGYGKGEQGLCWISDSCNDVSSCYMGGDGKCWMEVRYE